MELMKNGLAEPAIDRIAYAFSELVNKGILKEFPREAFKTKAINGIEELELKERVTHIIESLASFLPRSFPETAEILTHVSDVWDHGNPDDPLRSFAAWPITDYIAKYGLEHPDSAMLAMRSLTNLFSSEFAIRPFILKYPELCHAYFSEWVNSDCEHIRRLVSEGTRPRLPWGIRLQPYVEQPEPNLAYLNVLKDDDSLYVRRSVANHLNDIAKDNPDVVIATCKKWLLEVKNKPSKELEWVIKHATRSIVKQGHPDVFGLLGYTNDPAVDVELSLNSPNLALGENLNFNVFIRAQPKVKNRQKMVIDYAIHFVKANGKTSPKVFKLKNIELDPNGRLEVVKAHSIKPITTRKYYAGEHYVEIFVNGRSYAKAQFELTV